ncbi:MAG: type II/IV secretion system protein [Gammaproteobacteria bacterium]|nr:type II/IV secretion system protein [Gammaproteobacteria bacterium]
MLIQKGLISEDELKIALVEQRKSGRKLGEILQYMGFLSQDALRDTVGQSVGFNAISLTGILPDPQALSFIQEPFARAHQIMPVVFDAEQKLLKVALPNPEDIITIDKLRRHIQQRDVRLEFFVASEKEILEVIDHYYGYELSIDGILKELETGEINVLAMTQSDEYSHPVVRLANSLLTDAVKQNASDIHFEPEEFFIRVRYRIDGVLKQIRLLHRSFWPALLVRLKIIAEMNISETRLPQDGRINLTVAGRRIDFRASAQPTLHGENVVLRILDREKGIVPLKQLGLQADVLQEIQYMMAKPIGIFLVTGPTGSGKTTTLYSILNQLNEVGINIMTLEDPVEYPMAMIRQTNVNDDIGLTFATGIRSLMRQDPDVILVGEIRDEDTATMAVRAAMTGHQVYATLHANSVFGAIPRLLDIGVEKSILSGNIIGILAQRLVRKLCVHCKETYDASDFEKQLIGHAVEQPLTLHKAKGCMHCNHTGYKGRVSVVEVLRFDAELDEMVLQGISGKPFVERAVAKGFQSMAMMGFRLIHDGTTSLEEVARVIDLTEFV